MKRYLFLTLLVFCFVTTLLVYSNIVISVTPNNQVYCAKTKEDIEINTRSTLLNTEEVNLEETSLNNIEYSKEQELIQDTNLKSEEFIQNIQVENNKQENLSQNSKVIEDKSNNENPVLSNSEVKKQTSSESNVQESKYSFLKSSGNIDIQNLKIAENEISKLPRTLIDSFKKENWSILITTDNIAKKYFNGIYNNVLGVTITDENKIVIQNKMSSIQASLIHEMGHYLDWYFDFPSLDSEFYNIYEEEVNTFKSRITNSSSVRDEMEFFAHTFYYSIENPSKCTPKALEYVQRYLNEL